MKKYFAISTALMTLLGLQSCSELEPVMNIDHNGPLPMLFSPNLSSHWYSYHIQGNCLIC